MSFLTKTDIKRLFGLSAQQALRKSEQEALARFVRCTIEGCGGECKWMADVREFETMFRPDWSKLWARHKSKLPDVQEWAVFGEEDDVVLFIVRGKNKQGWTIDMSCEKLPLSDWQRSD